jgi:hypothetical protein
VFIFLEGPGRRSRVIPSINRIDNPGGQWVSLLPVFPNIESLLNNQFNGTTLPLIVRASCGTFPDDFPLLYQPVEFQLMLEPVSAIPATPSFTG